MTNEQKAVIDAARAWSHAVTKEQLAYYEWGRVKSSRVIEAAKEAAVAAKTTLLTAIAEYEERL
jgi:hypothetical protein